MIERELICQQLADEFEKSISDIFLKVSAACFYNRLRSFFVLNGLRRFSKSVQMDSKWSIM